MNRNHIFALAAVFALSAGTAALADDASSSTKSDQPVKDSYITTKVKGELTKDKGTKAHDIHVKTKDGIVMLTGTVSSTAEKELAEKDARKIKGVTDVHNDLTVQAAN